MNEFRNFESSQAHLNDSFSENRRTKLCEEAVRALAVLDEAIRVDSVLERTFSYLSSQELKRLSRVDTLWRNVAVKVLRKRSGNAPFILYWKTPVHDKIGFMKYLCFNLKNDFKLTVTGVGG